MFDDDGTAQDPLQLLATELGGDSRHDEAAAAAASGREGVYVVAQQPGERFQRAADIMRKRDQEDKRRQSQLRREIRMDKKARAKAWEGEDSDNEPTVRLGAASDDSEGFSGGGDSDSGDFSSDSGAASSSAPEDSGNERRGSGRSHFRGGKPEAAHAGMALKRSSSAVEPNPPLPVPVPKKRKATHELSLADQEALALQLLTSRR